MQLEWAKVSHDSRIKRISQPSCDLDKFVTQVKAHFKELAAMDYFFGATEKVADLRKAKFVLEWHSYSA